MNRRASRRRRPESAGRARAEHDADPEPEREAAGESADPEQVARTIALRQLAVQPRTREELARALRRRGVPDEVADRVLGRFSSVGLIDDAAFATAWVESRHAGRGLARRALAHELRRRGVGEEDVGGAVDKLSPETELATARALVERKLRSTRGLDGQTRLRRLVGMLARKGYPAGLSLRVVREALVRDDLEAAELVGLVDAMESSASSETSEADGPG